MSHDDDEELPASLRAMLRFEAEGEDLPAGFDARLRARLGDRLGDGGDGGDGGSGDGGDGGGGDGGGGDGGGAPPAPEPGTPPPGPGPGAGLVGTTAALGRVVSYFAIFSAGIGVGVVAGPEITGAPDDRSAHESTDVSPPPREALVTEEGSVDDAFVEAPSEGDVSEPDDPVEPDPPPVDPRPSARPRPPPPALPRAEEDGRVLLTQARVALSRGLANEALVALRQHRDRFPRAALTEEREALTVQSLAAAGQTATARQEAAVFLARYPHSIFGERVREAVAP